MGDRSNIFIQQHKRPDGKWDGIGLYTHWHGQALFSVALRGVEKAQGRIGDPSYFARIVIHHVLNEIADPDSELGFGLWTTRPCDNEHPILVINSQTGEHWFTDDASFATDKQDAPPWVGVCDCGATYDVGSRADHDADAGTCWNCSDRDPHQMTEDEWDEYLVG